LFKCILHIIISNYFLLGDYVKKLEYIDNWASGEKQDTGEDTIIFTATNLTATTTFPRVWNSSTFIIHY